MFAMLFSGLPNRVFEAFLSLFHPKIIGSTREKAVTRCRNGRFGLPEAVFSSRDCYPIGLRKDSNRDAKR